MHFTQTNFSSIGVVIDSSVNVTSPSTTPAIQSIRRTATNESLSHTFILKFKTKQIRVCQLCHRNYEGASDTAGLVVSRLERRLVSNLATGAQFMGKESNSHYHAHMACLQQVCPSFKGTDLI